MKEQFSQSSKYFSSLPIKATFKLRAKRRLIQGAGILLLAGIATASSYFVYRQFVLLPRAEEQAKTQTVSVETTTLPVTVTANGTVEPEQLTNVSPKTSERLESVTVSEGDSVEAGEIVAYMDDSDLQGQLLQAQGELAASAASLAMLVAGNRPQEIAQAEATLASAKASLSQTEEVLQRYESYELGFYKLRID